MATVFITGGHSGIGLECARQLAARRFNLVLAGRSPARMSMVHHRDIDTVVNFALTGALDGHVINVSDDAPTSFFELFELVGATMEPSSEPLANPWHWHLDNNLARSLGFRPTVNTVQQAVLENRM